MRQVGAPQDQSASAAPQPEAPSPPAAAPAPSVEAAVPPPPAPAPPPETASAPDPQFKSDLGTALTQCILPEAQKGNAAIDEAQAANLLVGKCQGPWLAWVGHCVEQGDSKENCIRKSTSFTRAAVKQLSTTN
jgi:hypothetical protein